MGGKKMVKTDALAVSRQTIAKIAGHDVQTMLKDWAHSAAETARAAIAQLPRPWLATGNDTAPRPRARKIGLKPAE